MPRSPHEPPPTISLWPLFWILVVPVGLAYGAWRLFGWWLLSQDLVLPD